MINQEFKAQGKNYIKFCSTLGFVAGSLGRAQSYEFSLIGAQFLLCHEQLENKIRYHKMLMAFPAIQQYTIHFHQ